MTEKKLDERLNEMARRLNKANQSNELRYKQMSTEYENMKLQVVAAKKGFLRKAEDLDLASTRQIQTLQSQLERAVEFAQSNRAELEEARVVATALQRMNIDLENSADLQKRSVDAISKLRATLEDAKEEKKMANERADNAEILLAEAKAEIVRLREEMKQMRENEEMLRLKSEKNEERLQSESDKRKVEQEQTLRGEHASVLEEAKLRHAEEKEELETQLRAMTEEKVKLQSELDKVKALPVSVPPIALGEGKRRNSGGVLSVPSVAPLRVRAERKVSADDDMVMSFLSTVGGGSPRTRSASLAEALGEVPPIRKRAGSISLPREASIMFTDDVWKTWVTEPYVYDAWSVFQNSVPAPRETGPLILTIKGHSFEFGMPSAPPLGDSSVLEFVEPLERVLYYQKNIGYRDHVHFLCASTSGEHMVVTIEAANAFNRSTPLLALVQTKKQSLRAIVDMEKSTPLSAKSVQIDEFLNSTFPGCNLKRVDNPAAHDLVSQRLIEFENMHLDFSRRVGILYWKSGQNENEAFGNNMSPGLDEFLNFFGTRIRLKGWSKFRGGLNVNNDETGEFSVFAEFEKFGFMCHVSALLPYRESDEQKLDRKRHIGNDLVVIIFWEGPGSFDASMLVTQMCHVFIVFERVPSLPDSQLPRYRVGVVCRSGVQPFRPYLPAPAEFDADEKLRTWLFMKIINGERATFQARTFLTKTSTARKILLDKIARETLALLGADTTSFTAPNLVISRMVMREPMTRVKAVAAFQGVAPSHLSFKKGDELILYCRPSAEWWNGGIGGKRGDFPQVKVQEKERKEEKKEKRKWGKQRSETTSASITGASVSKGGSSSPSIASITIEAAPTHEIGFTFARAFGLVLNASSTHVMVKMHIVSVNGVLEGSFKQTSKVAKAAAVDFGESFQVRILDPMWEVLHVEVHELDAAGASKAIGVTEISCGELIVNCDSLVRDYVLEAMPDAKPLLEAAVTLSVDKVVELQRPVLLKSVSTLTGE
jgi:hypothetical protein